MTHLNVAETKIVVNVVNCFYPSSGSPTAAADHEPTGGRQDALQRPAAAPKAEPGLRGLRSLCFKASRRPQGQEEEAAAARASISGLESGVQPGFCIVLVVILIGVALSRHRGHRRRRSLEVARGGVAGEGLDGVAQAGRGPCAGPGRVALTYCLACPVGRFRLLDGDAAYAQLRTTAEGRGRELGAQVRLRHGPATEDGRGDWRRN